MKKINFRKFKFGKMNINDLDDRTLLINLYATQFLTLSLGLIIIGFQENNRLIPMLSLLNYQKVFIWGSLFTIIVIVADLLISRWVPDEVTDDGGVNKKIFRTRALWHIAVLSLVIAICEEILFRGAVQHYMGPYWTSIVFAAIHIRYLRHWLMTGLVFGISYGLGWIYIQTGSLWTPILAHFLIDFVMGCIIRYGRNE
ncbi:MAG TPA: type II CAAX endopeptidase family protein [Bacilli bacterium]